MNSNLRQELTPIQNKRRQLLWPVSLVLLLLAAGSYYYWQRQSAAQTEQSRSRHFYGMDKPAVVSVITTTQGDFPVYLNGLGTVTALKTVTVKPKVDGELVKVLFSEGQLLKQGDVLAEIDPRLFQIQLQQAQGQLQRDEALLENAQLDLDRYKTLLAQDSIAAQQVATQQSLVKQYQGSVEIDKAQVNNARLQLSYTKITAPVSGRAGLRQIDRGNIVKTTDAQGLVVITQTQPINVVFTLPEDKVQKLSQRVHASKTIRVEAYDRAGKAKLADGQLVAVDNQIDASTGTIKLKAQFSNAENTLFANQFVNIRMHLETLPRAIQVDSAGIQHDAEGAFVYLVDEHKNAQIKRVEPGPSEAEKTVVLRGLTADDLVIISGIDKVKAGAKVDIAEKNGQPVAAEPGATKQSEIKAPS